MITLTMVTSADAQDSPTPVIRLGPVWAVDGDTLTDGIRQFHLVEIDAPEIDQPCFLLDGLWWRCGVGAKQALDRAVRGRMVSCVRALGHDGTGRSIPLVQAPDWSVHVCRAGDAASGTDLAGAMIDGGWALAAASGHSGQDLRRREEQALIAARGIWQGSIERPDLWRERW